jgi:hypothetical protein
MENNFALDFSFSLLASWLDDFGPIAKKLWHERCSTLDSILLGFNVLLACRLILDSNSNGFAAI